VGALVAQVNWGLETARKREVQTSEVKPVAGRAGMGVCERGGGGPRRMA
jgi:hypothetical protein